MKILYSDEFTDFVGDIGLKSCPLCGGKPIMVHHAEFDTYSVYCRECGIHFNYVNAPLDNAAGLWSSRFHDPDKFSPPFELAHGNEYINMKVCPFCGGSPVYSFYHEEGPRHYIWCPKCHTQSYKYLSLGEALQAWNQRFKPRRL